MAQPNGHHVAHLNWGILRADWDAPEVAPFVAALAEVNALAERSAGFVARLEDDEMEAAQADPAGPFGGNPRLAATLSVWRTPADLDAFVHRSLHGHYLRRRGAWFDPQPGRTYVLWWVEAGHRPTLDEALQRLAALERDGPTGLAFDFPWWRRQERGHAA